MLDSLDKFLSKGYIKTGDEFAEGFDWRTKSFDGYGHKPIAQWRRDIFALTGCDVAGKYLHVRNVWIYCEAEIGQCTPYNNGIIVKSHFPTEIPTDSKIAVFSCVCPRDGNSKIRFMGQYQHPQKTGENMKTYLELFDNKFSFNLLESNPDTDFNHHFSFEMLFDNKEQMCSSYYAIKMEVLRSFSILHAQVKIGTVDNASGEVLIYDHLDSKSIEEKPQRYRIIIYIDNSIKENEFVVNIQAICKRILQMEEINHGNLNLQPRFLFLDDSLSSHVVNINNVFVDSESCKNTVDVLNGWIRIITSIK